ncbi:MAG TPA: hypothetical protein VF145_02215 [Chitinophagaceae bacterium]
MIEKQNINGQEVWIKVDPHPVQRKNPRVIPTEYFTAACFYDAPAAESHSGEVLKDEQGEVLLFESPVAAVAAASQYFERSVNPESRSRSSPTEDE